jgi:hypothetical protein
MPKMPRLVVLILSMVASSGAVRGAAGVGARHTAVLRSLYRAAAV